MAKKARVRPYIPVHGLQKGPAGLQTKESTAKDTQYRRSFPRVVFQKHLDDPHLWLTLLASILLWFGKIPAEWWATVALGSAVNSQWSPLAKLKMGVKNVTDNQDTTGGPSDEGKGE